MYELALFAGAGGGILGGKLLGWNCVGAVELNAFCARRLMQRQNEGHLPPFPVWDDVRTFDGRRWRGVAEMVSGGFPCKGVSVAGPGTGLDHEESSLWGDQARIIGESEARYVWIENSPALTFRGGVRVIGDLAAMGYDCRWGVVSAADAIWSYGTPCLDHLRERIWIAGTRANTAGDRRPQRDGKHIGRSLDSALGERGRDQPRRIHADGAPRAANPEGAHAQELRCGPGIMSERTGETFSEPRGNRSAGTDASCEHLRRESVGLSGCPISAEPVGSGEADTDPDDSGRQQQRCAVADGAKHQTAECGSWWAAEPAVGRMAHGVANRVDQLTAIGNGQVPAVVQFAWQILNPTN